MKKVRIIIAKSHSSLFTLHFIIVLRFYEDGNNHEDEAEKANERSHHDSACTEDVGIEGFFCSATTRHEDEAQHHDEESYHKEDVVELAKCKIIFHIFLGFCFISRRNKGNNRNIIICGLLGLLDF